MRRNRPLARRSEQQSSGSMIESLEGRTLMSVSVPSQISSYSFGVSQTATAAIIDGTSNTLMVSQRVSITDGTSNTALLLPAIQKVREAAARMS